MNGISKISFNPISNVASMRASTPAFRANEEADKVQINSNKRPDPPKISTLRLMFGILKDEQVKQINEAGRLPDNAKFVANGVGGYSICNNFFGLRVGTQKIPAGFEVRKDVFGFACVLPEDTNGLMVKNK